MSREYFMVSSGSARVTWLFTTLLMLQRLSAPARGARARFASVGAWPARPATTPISPVGVPKPPNLAQSWALIFNIALLTQVLSHVRIPPLARPSLSLPRNGCVRAAGDGAPCMRPRLSSRERAAQTSVLLDASGASSEQRAPNHTAPSSPAGLHRADASTENCIPQGALHCLPTTATAGAIPAGREETPIPRRAGRTTGPALE